MSYSRHIIFSSLCSFTLSFSAETKNPHKPFTITPLYVPDITEEMRKEYEENEKKLAEAEKIPSNCPICGNLQRIDYVNIFDSNIAVHICDKCEADWKNIKY